ncbi:MAG: SLBB domain-containing protein [Terracidiphilus sp.]
MNCADPAETNSPDCSAQSQYPATSQTPYPAGSAESNPSRPPAANSSNPYSDTEQINPQSRNGNPLQQVLPLEPLTELQKFIASTTGQILPIFGADLFRRVPSTFAPLNLTPVPMDYILGPGDELRIRVWGQVNFQSNLRVDRAGDVFLPQIGPVHIAGLHFSELDGHLRAAVGRIYHNFDLTADVGQIRAIQVYVSGQARRPGVYTVSSLSTLVDTLFASGGPSIEGSLRSIELRRDGAIVTRFDLYDLLIKGDKSKDAKLESGDVIFIPPVGSQAAMIGSVRNPGIYELLPQEPLSSLLADAGGVSSVAAEARVSIERIDEHHDRSAMEVAYDTNGLATVMTDGDLVRVYSIVPLYQKTVTIRGNTANPGRFAWHQGMHVSDLIPDKAALVTRNYWWQRAQLGLPAPEFDSIQGMANMRQPTDNHPVTIQLSPPPGTATSQQPGTQENQTGPDQNQYPAEPSQSQYPPDNQQNPSGNQQYQSLTAQQRSGSAALGTAEITSPNRVISPSQRTEVKLLAPEIDWNYAVIERLNHENLKTTLIPFDLGRLVLQHDTSQDLELEAGDVVSIFSEADIRIPIAEQTKLIHLDGEFVHPGAYTATPGETLRQLVQRAGGLTQNAYLYGSVFTRESTRAVQQARIDEYVQSLSMQIERSNLALAGSPGASSAALASGSLAQASEHDFLASLRQIRATGRVVLHFQPSSSNLDTLPDVALEDGDRLIVPHVPAVVNVIGAVYDQNSFLYAQRQAVGAYLKQAGGPNRIADWKHEFLIRADGEVISRDISKGLWGNEFDSLRVNPGDSIVVPEKAFKPSALVGVLDWSQLFSQFALGASALSVIH